MTSAHRSAASPWSGRAASTPDDDPATKEPLDARRRTGYAIYKKALSLGLVLRPLGDILYFNPPLNITREEFGLAIEMAHEAVTAVLPEA